MKRIKFNKILKNPAPKHFKKAPYLVPGVEPLRGEFTNRKEAVKHCNNIARQLNLAAVEINLIYIEAFTVYRRLIFNLKNAEAINQQFNNFHFNFNRLFIVTANYEHFVFINFNKCHEAIKKALQLLQEEARANYDFNLLLELKSLQKRLTVSAAWVSL